MSDTDPAWLAVCNLSVSYGSHRAVEHVSFDLASGCSLALAGSNGAGKTSVLNALAGLRIPGQQLDGVMTFNDAALNWGDVSQHLAAGIRLVPEREKVFGLLSVTENLRIGAQRARSDRIRLDDVLGWFPRLGERSKTLAGNLSGGEQQMLGIGLSLLASPELLLLDEPTLGLAVPVIEDLYQRLAQLRRETGLTMIVAESDSQWLSSLADRAIVIDRGRQLRSFDVLAERDIAAIHDLMLGLAQPRPTQKKDWHAAR
jgi:branched-chain amino acid transport system ATP-binding protein